MMFQAGQSVYHINHLKMNQLFTDISCNFLAIDEVGGVPFEILEPVLERCTPEQLYRIEQCNQVRVSTQSHADYLFHSFNRISVVVFSHIILIH